MKELDEYRKRTRAAGAKRVKAEEQQNEHRDLLRLRQNELTEASRQGHAKTEIQRELQHEIDALKGQIEGQKTSAQDLQRAPLALMRETAPEPQPWKLVEGWNDNLPCLLLPVRIETRFSNEEDRHELWVRIFPDDIAVHTHEDKLTRDELRSGRTFWREKLRSKIKGDLNIEKGAWRVLAESYGGPRAAWIKDQTYPSNWQTATKVNELRFPDPPGGTLKPESWSRAPHSNVMPDRFVVMGFRGGQEVFRQAGNPIHHPLTLGPNPTRQPEEEFVQEGGELRVGEQIAWIYDFQQAVKIGLGMIIALDTATAEQGLDQLFVLGLRLSTDENETQTLVEELLENHIYSPRGLSFIPQGTATNNTERQGSGFSSADLGAEVSFALETKRVLVPVNDHLVKRDGQRFVEALGLNYTPQAQLQDSGAGEHLGIGQTALQRIEHADRNDVEDALHMNRALWSGTLGYYMDEMLELSLGTIDKLRRFFLDNVTGRGSVPAIRLGIQPDGMLITSDFSRWKWSPEQDGALLPELDELHGMMRTLQDKMAEKIPLVARAGQDDGSDPFGSLLETLGLQASSVEFYRRYAVARQYLWNHLLFRQGPLPAGNLPDQIRQRQRMLDERDRLVQGLDNEGRSLAGEAGISAANLPDIFRLVFFEGQDAILDPVVDDIPAEEQEKLSETQPVRAHYPDPRSTEPSDQSPKVNYIAWLGYSSYLAIRDLDFAGAVPDGHPFPRPLLYRMLRTSLLQALYEAALKLFLNARKGPFEDQQDRLLALPIDRLERFRVLHREVELINIRNDPSQRGTITRWEYLNEDINNVLAEEPAGRTVGEFLLSEAGLQREESGMLRETMESIRALAMLSTAQLERVFSEHIDLCSYRLDAWQTGFFHWRLLQQRFPSAAEPAVLAEEDHSYKKLVQGLYLGAFGWLEDLRPAAPMTPADLSAISPSLHDPAREGAIYEQPENKGFLHGPSLNHAVTGAILRSSYLNHFDPRFPEVMAVNLSSERVRVALSFLDGVRNGQDLGALLGYQFERGLADRHNDPSLNRFVKFFREKYPVMAEKILPGPNTQPNGTIQLKEARNIFDGYALLEAAFHRESPLRYPYDVDHLPTDEDSPEAKAIQAEVDRMRESLDAIADLSLSEGVYQAAQGNFERAGAILKAMTQGESPPEPEIVRTPRTGATITQRVALHLPSDGNAKRWAGPATVRAALEPGLNAWLADLLPGPNRIGFFVSFGDGEWNEVNLVRLAIEPIDLIYMIGDDLDGETTELESRIAFVYRRQEQNDILDVKIDFRRTPDPRGSISLFALLPLLRALRRVVTGCRPLSANDYQLSSEASTDLTENPHPQGVDLDRLKERIQVALDEFKAAVTALGSAIPPNGPDGKPDARLANAAVLRAALRKLSEFGVPDAFPLSAYSGANAAKFTLTPQAVSIFAIVAKNLKTAEAANNAANQATSEPEIVEHCRSAARVIFGPAFNLIPAFSFGNEAELQAATQFREAAPERSLTRFHAENMFLVDEWLEGAARVQTGLGALETVTLLSANLVKPPLHHKPMQLPFRTEDHWVGVEYPETFQPVGEYVSILQILPQPDFDPVQPQSGLVIDEWVETIPSKSEATGIALHFDQPNSEPPQVCLLAVTPEITGAWTWDKLVGILQDTIARAKQRAVEPEHLQDTAYAQFLPAVIAPIASRRFATITEDFVHSTARVFENRTGA